ncbi:hypothetical protein BK645_10115 [Pseudomonas protegens]|uniref:hypothetical protein n=1 Tax=Pseudomonas protegens TaxID=380021 RepID=UPI00031749CD|nr:hypothetical protein [Pseudomonas protegens]ROM29315.1 hypothetical protein BK645_10115 [Pseudomonas protegens]ROM36948.1 hypothetical protein BK646_18160 [Pseudomonas protegens]
MADQKHHLREAVIEAISDIAQHLPLDCQMFVIACRPGKADFDLVLPSPEANLNNALDALRRNGLSIDGDNAYKRDLLDSVVGALAFGAQNNNPPTAGHWGQSLWDIGREERALTEELVAALKLTRENLRACQATIHLCGGFDPAYVNDAQAAMAVADKVLAKVIA